MNARCLHHTRSCYSTSYMQCLAATETNCARDGDAQTTGRKPTHRRIRVPFGRHQIDHSKRRWLRKLVVLESDSVVIRVIAPHSIDRMHHTQHNRVHDGCVDAIEFFETASSWNEASPRVDLDVPVLLASDSGQQWIRSHCWACSSFTEITFNRRAWITHFAKVKNVRLHDGRDTAVQHQSVFVLLRLRHVWNCLLRTFSHVFFFYRSTKKWI